MLEKIFPKRKLILVTDDKILNIPLKPGTQLLILCAVAVVVAWASFSSGKYYTYKKVLKQKEFEVHQANLINLDLQTKIDNLQGNLVRLNQYFSTVKEFDFNRGGEKQQRDLTLNKKKNDKTSFNEEELSKMMANIPNYKKGKVFTKKAKVVSDISSNTSTRINDLKNIVAMTGLRVSDFERKYDKIAEIRNNEEEDFENQGGPATDNIANPFFPAADVAKEANFSGNLDQLLYFENFVNSLPLGSPMEKYYISSRYGERVDAFTRKLANHYGTDFAGPFGTQVYSTGPGIVKFSGRKGNYGNLVEIDHGYGVTTRYAHLSKLLVRRGDRITRGQLIGRQGTSGRSTGPHLHYEVRYKKRPYNPENFLKAGSYVL